VAWADSPDRQAERGQWQSCKPEAFDDVVDAVGWVSPDNPSNVILVGLCSGGYQALESALAIRPRGVVAINPMTSFVPPESLAGLQVDPRRLIVFPSDDVVENFREAKRPRNLRQRLPGLAWKLRLITHPRRRSGRWLDQLVRQGTDTLLVCGDAEIQTYPQGCDGGAVATPGKDGKTPPRAPGRPAARPVHRRPAQSRDAPRD